ncbi:MAG: hypothetical protein IAF94_04145 [Pirellulaceae bacterium]|nr:hypothetical protein [Pirellulaceae bacterium]
MNFFPDLENHKGQAKVRRLQQVLPAAYFKNGRLVRCHGYTDSCADLPMLELCETATVVNPSLALAETAREFGWEIVRPARPWKSRREFILRSAAVVLAKTPQGILVQEDGENDRRARAFAKLAGSCADFPEIEPNTAATRGARLGMIYLPDTNAFSVYLAGKRHSGQPLAACRTWIPASGEIR